MEKPGGITRRTAFRAAAGAGIGVAAALSPGLPAWARPILKTLDVKGPGALPNPSLPEGTPTMPQIEHIVVVMMENHSFDNMLGMLPQQVSARRGVDGLPVDAKGRPTPVNRGQGRAYRAPLAPTPCQEKGHPGQNWNASHVSYAAGRNSGFVRASGPVAMWYWDRDVLPATYSLAATFPVGQRYFGSVLA